MNLYKKQYQNNLHFYHSTTLRWHRCLKSFLMEDRDMSILHGQNTIAAENMPMQGDRATEDMIWIFSSLCNIAGKVSHPYYCDDWRHKSLPCGNPVEYCAKISWLIIYLDYADFTGCAMSSASITDVSLIISGTINVRSNAWGRLDIAYDICLIVRSRKISKGRDRSLSFPVTLKLGMCRISKWYTYFTRSYRILKRALSVIKYKVILLKNNIIEMLQTIRRQDHPSQGRTFLPIVKIWRLWDPWDGIFTLSRSPGHHFHVCWTMHYSYMDFRCACHMSLYVAHIYIKSCAVEFPLHMNTVYVHLCQNVTMICPLELRLSYINLSLFLVEFHYI